jgi:hypothetical protein
MNRERGTEEAFESGEPVPIVEGEGTASEMLRAATNEYRADLDEAAAWRRLAPTLRGRAVPQRLGTYLAIGFAAGVAFLLFGKPRQPVEVAHGGAAVVGEPPAPMTLPAPQNETATTEEPVVRPSTLPRALREGKTRLADGSVVRVATGSDATVRLRSEEGTTIELARGSLDLEVTPQTDDRRVEVVSGMYHFVALGTQFHVSVASERIDLDVVEGTVGVFAGPKLLARVEPGSSWSSASQLPHATAPSDLVVHPQNTPPAANPPSGGAIETSGAGAPDCALLGRSGNTQAELDCYGRQSERTGMSGELALYEIARLKKDVLSDYAGALDALKTYDARFPNGSLRGEVQVSRVELLGRLGRNDEALAESARLLQTPWGKERASDLHLLRGNLYRQSLHDFARAEAEYALVSDERGPAGDEAQFQRAFCLERLGQAQAALRAYESYLKRPHPRHISEAQARIQALAP